MGSQEPNKFWKSLSLNVWDGMIWNPENPHTRITNKGPVHDFLFHFIYLKILFEDLVWRSCLKILFEDFVQYKGHYREKKIIIEILKIYFEDLFWRSVLKIYFEYSKATSKQFKYFDIRLCQDANVMVLSKYHSKVNKNVGQNLGSGNLESSELSARLV